MVGEEKRKISVGFLEPSELEGNTIYVTLTPHVESIRADAISKEDFVYYSKERIKSSGTKCDNYMFSSRREGAAIYKHHWAFIDELCRENDAKISRNRMETEGIKLSRLVQKMNYETSVIKGAF